MTLQDILKDDYSKLTQFSEEEKTWLEKRIKLRKDGKPGVECILRGKTGGNDKNDYFELNPEEVVRQIYARKLIEEYEYKKERIVFEHTVQMGRDESKSADIVVFEDDAKTSPYIVVECKAAGKNKIKGQLESYCKTLGASIAIEIDGGETKEFYYNRQDSQNKNYKLEKIDRLPKATQTLSEILNDRFTIKDLIVADSKNTRTLKDIVLDLEDKVLANSGVDEFEEVFKFIFAKLYDEYLCADENEKIATLMNEGYLKNIESFNDENFTQMQFRSVGSENQVLEKVQHLFDEAQTKWTGIFPANTKFLLNPADVKNIVSYLENVKLFNSNLDVVDDTFEHLVNQTKKGEKGQYFTPRYVIDMCVKMLNPTETESMIDTASGSCGFPMHTIFHVWHKMNPKRQNFVNAKRSQKETDYVEQKIFAIDFDPKSVRVGRLLNIIAGDGKSNVLELNTLDYNTWNTRIQDENWRKVNISGFDKMIAFAKDEKSYKEFNFDIVMANPPFAGDRNDSKVISLYDLGHKGEKSVDNIGRDILFIERNLNFLKPGGRMAVVLPQGRFNNSSDKYIRDYIAERCRILAVVGLHGNAFKPHTGTKTSVLFVQKWTDENCGFPNICPKKDDYPIFFATMQEASKDNSGEKIYVSENYVSWTKFSYKIENEKIISIPEEMTTSYGDTKFVKDLFIKDNGTLESHKKWILKPVMFVPKKMNEKNKDEKLLIDEYLKLSSEKKKQYKEAVNIYDCDVYTDNEIDFETYNSFSKEKQKLCLPLETITEFSEKVKDTHGHIFVKHDLFNHDEALDELWKNRDERLKGRYSKDGIAEAFQEFAKKEALSFFR